MSRGKRYDKEPKLNMKKVLAVVVAIVMTLIVKKKLNKETK